MPHRNLTDEDRIDAVQTFWDATQPEPATQERYRRWRTNLDDRSVVPAYRTLAKTAAEFAAICRAADVPVEESTDGPGRRGRRTDWTRRQAHDALRKCFEVTGAPLTGVAYEVWRESLADPSTVPSVGYFGVGNRTMPRSCEGAGVPFRVTALRGLSDDEVAAIAMRCFPLIADRPTTTRWDQLRREDRSIPVSTELMRRWGSWPGIVSRFLD